MLVNLVKNALKYCEGKPILILAAYDKQTKKLEVQVIDEGRGVPDDEHARLTSIFHANAKSESSLFVCKKLIEVNGGSIRFWNNEV